ncbi:MAG: hypothetical protein LBQ88_21105 [Treponema sp.]|jgi:transaldolase|nr:hypothetical protein [Treponema sp.]
MDIALLNTRRAVVFAASAGEFRNNVKKFMQQLQHELINGGNKDDLCFVVYSLCLDLQSWLIHWNLLKYVTAGQLLQEDIDNAVSGLRNLLQVYCPEKIIELNREVNAVKSSAIVEICELTEKKTLFTRWGHDYCSGLDYSIRRGARFLTSNPVKINAFRKEENERWAVFLEEVRAENPGITKERLISLMCMKVVALHARELYPIHEATDGEDGFACIQVNVKNRNNTKKMIDEVFFWEEAFRKELNMDNPNIVYKLPAVKAAIPVVQTLVAQGIRVCMTLNFSCSQHDIFADILQKGARRSFMVIMSGFLDDSVVLELQSLGVENPKLYACHAGEAVLRKSYANLRAKEYNKVSIMVAAIRGDYTIKSCLTGYNNAPLYFTTVTKMIQAYDNAPRKSCSEIDEPISRDIMEVLTKSSIFNKAYNRNLLNLDNLNDFEPLNAVLKVFVSAFEEIEASLP